MSIDSIGNFLTIVRNGTMVAKPYVFAPFSREKFALAQILKKEGFIKDVLEMTDPKTEKPVLKVVLKYVDGESVIHEIRRISKPGCRLYNGKDNIKPVIGGLGLSVLTTDRGVISHKEAIRLGVGGEIICTVW